MFYISLNHSTLGMYVVHKVLNGVFEEGIANDTLRYFDEFENIVAGVISSFHLQSLILRSSLNGKCFYCEGRKVLNSLSIAQSTCRKRNSSDAFP